MTGYSKGTVEERLSALEREGVTRQKRQQLTDRLSDDEILQTPGEWWPSFLQAAGSFYFDSQLARGVDVGANDRINCSLRCLGTFLGSIGEAGEDLDAVQRAFDAHETCVAACK